MFSSRKPLRLTILLALVILVIALPLLYYFVWRLPDNTYQAASDQLKTMRTASSNINRILGGVSTAGNIDDTFVSDLNNAAAQYNASFKSLAATAAVTRDSKLKPVFDQYRESLTSYGSLAKDTTTGTDKYRAILDACSGIVTKLSSLSTVTAFDTVASVCEDAIKSAESAPKTDFTDQFLTKYTGYATDYVAAYRAQIQAKNSKASQSTVESVKQKISTLGKQELTLALSDPTADLQKLEDTVKAQKSAFFR